MRKLDIKGDIICNEEKWIYDYLEWDGTCPKDITKALEDANGEDVEVTINASTKKNFNVKLKPDTKALKEVVVKTKRKRYSRKNNPAVELMKKVIEAKKPIFSLNRRNVIPYCTSTIRDALTVWSRL